MSTYAMTGSDAGSTAHPMPPARTRWIELREGTMAGGGLPLRPVRSHEKPQPQPPSATPPQPILSLAAAATPEGDSAQTETVTETEAFAFELPLAPDADTEPLLLMEEEAVEPILLEDDDDASPLPDMHPVHAPLSPWELTGETLDVASSLADDERAARGRREWEAFGEAIVAALDLDEQTSLETAMRAIAQRLEQPDPPESSVPIEIVDLADRIASFASRLRAHGYAIIADAQTAGDRLDSALARIAASHLEGGSE